MMKQFIPLRAVVSSTGYTRAELIGEGLSLYDADGTRYSDEVHEAFRKAPLGGGCVVAPVSPSALYLATAELGKLFPAYAPPPARRQAVPSVQGATRSRLTAALVQMLAPAHSREELAELLGGQSESLNRDSLNGALLERYLIYMDEVVGGATSNPYRKKNGTPQQGKLAQLLRGHMGGVAVKTIGNHLAEALKNFNDFPEQPPAEELLKIFT